MEFIDKLIIAKRLRVIEWLEGFYRGDESCLVPPQIIGESDWFPAIELFGEGLFFTLDEKILSKWEQIPSVIDRANEIIARYEKSLILPMGVATIKSIYRL